MSVVNPTAQDASGEAVAAAGQLGLTRSELTTFVSAQLLKEFAESSGRIFGLSVSILTTNREVLAGSVPSSVVQAPIERGAPTPFEHITSQGARYVVGPLNHNQEPIAMLVLGPLDIPVARAKAIFEHLTVSLGMLAHSGERAHYASTMHIASISESYRELKERNRDLEQAYVRLQELDHLKSSFLATISHELRTPLTSIIGYSEMLAEGIGGALNPEQLEFATTIRRKGEQLLSLIMSLLDLSKLESGTLSMQLSNLPIHAILSDAVSTAMPKALKKGVALALSSEGQALSVVGDPDRLRQVFVNLVDNAVKFTPTGGRVAVSVEEHESETGDDPGLILMQPFAREAVIRVADSGVGIAEHERTRIFDPFYQVDQSSTREQGGAGLGLAIVKRIVDGHQGQITVGPNSPQGTVFVVRIPSAAPPSSMRPRSL